VLEGYPDSALARGPQLSAVLTATVENPKDHDGFTLDAIEQLVRKPPCEDSANAAVVYRRTKGIGFQSNQGLGCRREKLVAQPRSLLLVPPSRFIEITLPGDANGDAPAHRDAAVRIRLKTSRQGLPFRPSCSNVINSRSRSAVSAGSGTPPCRRVASSICHKRSRISWRSSARSRGSSAMISLLLMPGKYTAAWLGARLG
jgi:hypothetical protein